MFSIVTSTVPPSPGRAAFLSAVFSLHPLVEWADGESTRNGFFLNHPQCGTSTAWEDREGGGIDKVRRVAVLGADS
jgi:hypothetical protein